MISPLFTTIVLCSAFIWIFMKVTTKQVGQSTDELLEKERLANNSRKRPIDNLDYIDFNENSIPFTNPAPNERIEAIQQSLCSLFGKKIVNLTGITNTDLKLSYGAANLPALSEYDQNFTSLTKSLYDLGVELDAAGLRDTAKIVLAYAVSIGTDISGNYICLANIFVEEQNYSGINSLITSATSIKSLTRDVTVARLQEILDNHTTLVVPHSSDSVISSQKPDNILPKDILDILETVPYKSDDQN